MKRSVRRIAALLLLPSLALSLAACGGEGETSAEPSPSASPMIGIVEIAVPSLEPKPQYVTEYVGTVVDVSSFLRVRTGPGTDFDVLGQALAGEKYTVLEQNVDGGEWHKISFGGQEGFVHGSYLAISEVQVELP